MSAPPGLTPQLTAFNEELASICSDPPPVTKSKMKGITSRAMKANRTYKHVVQNVEKFISKSDPKYKLAGLYVMDSIIRKSRADFGPERDVYAPRFQKNMLQTFQHIGRSQMVQNDKEKSKKVIRLWKSGKIYTEEFLEQLEKIMERSAPNNDQNNTQTTETKSARLEAATEPKNNASELIHKILSDPESDMARNLTNMLAGPQREHLQEILGKMKAQNQSEPQSPPGMPQDHSPLVDEVEVSGWNKPPPGNNIPIRTINPVPDFSQPPPSQANIWNQGPVPVPSPVQSRDSFRDRDRRRSRSKSPRKSPRRRSRSPRRRSRSRSRDRRRKSRSKSRDRRRSRSRDRRRRSRSRESRRSGTRRDDERSVREKMCLPPKKAGMGCVASRTIWIGNITKGGCSDETVRAIIHGVQHGEDIEDITSFHSRGCAYIVMKTRAAAFKTLSDLHRDRRRDEKRKVDWAINNGLKNAQMADLFDKTEGAAFIPHDKLPKDIKVLIEWSQGGVIDIESMPDHVQKELQSRNASTINQSQEMDMEMDDEKEGVGGNPILPGMSGMQMMSRMNVLTPQLLNPQGVGPQGVQMRPMTLPPNLQGAFGQSGQPGPQGMPVIRLGPGGLIPMGVPMVNSQVPPPHGVNPQMPRLPHPPFLHQPPPSDVHPGFPPRVPPPNIRMGMGNDRFGNQRQPPRFEQDRFGGGPRGGAPPRGGARGGGRGGFNQRFDGGFNQGRFGDDRNRDRRDSWGQNNRSPVRRSPDRWNRDRDRGRDRGGRGRDQRGRRSRSRERGNSGSRWNDRGNERQSPKRSRWSPGRDRKGPRSPRGSPRKSPPKSWGREETSPRKRTKWGESPPRGGSKGAWGSPPKAQAAAGGENKAWGSPDAGAEDKTKSGWGELGSSQKEEKTEKSGWGSPGEEKVESGTVASGWEQEDGNQTPVHDEKEPLGGGGGGWESSPPQPQTPPKPETPPPAPAHNAVVPLNEPKPPSHEPETEREPEPEPTRHMEQEKPQDPEPEQTSFEPDPDNSQILSSTAKNSDQVVEENQMAPSEEAPLKQIAADSDALPEVNGSAQASS